VKAATGLTCRIQHQRSPTRRATDVVAEHRGKSGPTFKHLRLLTRICFRQELIDAGTFWLPIFSRVTVGKNISSYYASQRVDEVLELLEAQVHILNVPVLQQLQQVFGSSLMPP
jgi:hypothetical protein